jgi:hypothetical protein
VSFKGGEGLPNEGNQMDIKVVKHKLFPVSYINDKGEQVDCIYEWNPSYVERCKEWYIGEEFTVELIHPATMSDTAKIAKIAQMEAEVAKLKETLNA